MLVKKDIIQLVVPAHKLIVFVMGIIMKMAIVWLVKTNKTIY
jgi:hypothetical protein